MEKSEERRSIHAYLDLLKYHATAPNPGTVWTKLGPIVVGDWPQPFPGYLFSLYVLPY